MDCFRIEAKVCEIYCSGHILSWMQNQQLTFSRCAIAVEVEIPNRARHPLSQCSTAIQCKGSQQPPKSTWKWSGRYQDGGFAMFQIELCAIG